MRSLTLVSLLIVALILAACGGGGGATATTGTGGTTGDAAAGEAVFNQQANPPCNSCHSLQEGTTLVGPSLAHIGTAAATMESGKSAEQYIRESITDPDAFVVQGFPAGVMPKTYGQDLSEQQLNDLVAFLLSKK
jgi:cytochrome c551/c552